jgi:ComF family protein
MIFKKLKELFFPLYCLVCHEKPLGEVALCEPCSRTIEPLEKGCIICAVPMVSAALVCGDCLQEPPSFNQVTALAFYEGIARKLITRLKFSRDLVCGNILGSLLADKILLSAHPLPELLIPVPLHRRRMFKRGYNQAMELSRVLSARLHIPVDPHSCSRVRHTRAQTELPQNLRRKNIRGAFSVKNLNVDHVAIIDDVVTTASTVSELARELKRAGVKKVDVWCCARVS